VNWPADRPSRTSSGRGGSSSHPARPDDRRRRDRQAARDLPRVPGLRPRPPGRRHGPRRPYSTPSVPAC